MKKSLSSLVLNGLLGLVVGIITAVAAIVLGGAGHGWNSASITILSLVLFPCLGASLTSNYQPINRNLGALCLIGLVLFDAWLVFESKREGFVSVLYAARQAPLVFLIWFLSWGGFQLFYGWRMLKCNAPDRSCC